MILLNDEINALSLTNELVEKHDPELINGCGVDVRAGSLHFRESNEASEVYYDSAVANAANRYAIDWNDDGDLVVLQPKTLVILFTQERFNMPSWVQGECRVSASLAACGVGAINTPVLRPGWSGHLLLSLFNYNSFKSVCIKSGSVIGHVQFYNLGSEVRPYKGKFQNLGSLKA